MDLNMMSQRYSVGFMSVRLVWKPVNGINVFILQELTYSCHIRRGNIVHQSRFHSNTQRQGAIIYVQVCVSLSLLTHHQSDHAEQCWREHNVYHSFSRPFNICHRSSEGTCSYLWKAQSASASSGVILQMPVRFHGTVQWAVNTGPLYCHSRKLTVQDNSKHFITIPTV